MCLSSPFDLGFIERRSVNEITESEELNNFILFEFISQGKKIALIQWVERNGDMVR